MSGITKTRLLHETNQVYLEGMGYYLNRPIHWHELPKFLRQDGLRQHLEWVGEKVRIALSQYE